MQGFDFWRNSLGSAKLVVAPMVDQSELAWRILSRRHGAELCYTPMFHASVFVRDANYRKEALASCPEDRPLIIQFCANDPDTFLKAAKLAESHCEAVDLNLGCPQLIAKRGHYGAFLQDEWDLLHKMVSLCSKELKVPVTCKVRVFKDMKKTVEYAQMLENAGCQLLTVHGRTKDQKGPNTGVANWEHIKAVKESVKIPVFANGNIQYLADVHRCMAETGVDGVMSAEGNLHNPALFESVRSCVWDLAEEYLALVAQYPCPLSYVRGHIFKLLHHALLVHKELRDVLGWCKTCAEVKDVVQQVKTKSQEDVEAYARDPSSLKSELPLPYWICQPYVRPSPEESEERQKQRAISKRNMDLGVPPCQDGEKLSKNKLKKLRRNPKKIFETKGDKFEKCGRCLNPKGMKCDFDLCKHCCKRRAFEEPSNCDGHKLFGRNKHKKDEEQPDAGDASSYDLTKPSSDLSPAQKDDTCNKEMDKIPGQDGKAEIVVAIDLELVKLSPTNSKPLKNTHSSKSEQSSDVVDANKG